MKACDSCVSNRVAIGKHYKNMPVWVRAIGMIFIYLPIITLPFIFLSAYLSYYHLLMMGAQDVKKLKDFLPERESHRYECNDHSHGQHAPLQETVAYTLHDKYQ